MTLQDAAVGTDVRVKRLDVNGAGRRRLLDLGFVPGTMVRVLRQSPLGDPTAYLVRGATIALRGSDARLIAIEDR